VEEETLDSEQKSDQDFGKKKKKGRGPTREHYGYADSMLSFC